jgi:hypothetical protein
MGSEGFSLSADTPSAALPAVGGAHAEGDTSGI